MKVPPDDKSSWNNELGVWFETDWDHRGVVVKGCKRNKYAFNHTDIHPGDVLTHIDNKYVYDLRNEEGKLMFDTCMDMIKQVSGSKLHSVEPIATICSQSRVYPLCSAPRCSLPFLTL